MSNPNNLAPGTFINDYGCQVTVINGNPPKTWVLICFIKNFFLSLIALVLGVIGMFIQPIIILYIIREQSTNFAGLSSPRPHNILAYPEASGEWIYKNVPYHYKNGNIIQKFIWLFGNDLDGYLGDKRGEWSTIRKGDKKQEFSFMSMYIWSAFRNKTNNLRFSGKWFSVIPNECQTVVIYGKDLVLDNKPIDTGWYFIRAVSHGRVYYGYRAVQEHNDTDNIVGNEYATNGSIGFKLQPKHFVEGQAEPKGMTYRYSREDY